MKQLTEDTDFSFNKVVQVIKARCGFNFNQKNLLVRQRNNINLFLHQILTSNSSFILAF